MCLLYSEEVPTSKRKPSTSAKFILKKLPKTIYKSNDCAQSIPSSTKHVAAALEAGQMISSIQIQEDADH